MSCKYRVVQTPWRCDELENGWRRLYRKVVVLQGGPNLSVEHKLRLIHWLVIGNLPLATKQDGQASGADVAST